MCYLILEIFFFRHKDITIAFKYKSRMLEIIESTGIGWTPLGDLIKIFYKNSPRIENRQAKYPFIDVYFHNTTNCCVVHENWYRKFSTPKSDYFPLKLRPLGKYWLPVPSKPFSVLVNTGFQNCFNTCLSNSLDHRTEQTNQVYSVPCQALKDYHLFASRLCLTADNLKFCYEEFKISATKTVYLLEHNQSQLSVTVNKYL